MNHPPAARHRDYASTVTRLLATILRLSASRHWTAATLAHDLGVSERTVYRDLNRIRAAGLPLSYDDETGGYLIEWPARGFAPRGPSKPDGSTT